MTANKSVENTGVRETIRSCNMNIGRPEDACPSELLCS